MRIAILTNPLPLTGDMQIDQVNAAKRARLIESLMSSMQFLGHAVTFMEESDALIERLADFKAQLVFPLSFRTSRMVRAGEAQALLELHGIPFVGSPAQACRIAQNKQRTKQLLQRVGIPTSRFAVFEHPTDPVRKPDGLTYPLFVKPVIGGCSQGIHPANPVTCDRDLEVVVRETLGTVQMPVLVEEFLEGREFTVGILGNPPALTLPVKEFIHGTTGDRASVFRSFSEKTASEKTEQVICPAPLSNEKEQRIKAIALRAFQAIGCRDYVRVDIRCDRRGAAHVLEMNAHPNLSPADSFAGMAAACGLSHPQMVAAILIYAYERYGLHMD